MRLPLMLVCTIGFASGTASADQTIRVDLISSYDGEETWSMLHIPDAYTPGVPAPLVISCHGMGGSATDALNGVSPHSGPRGWIVAAPHTHGERSGGETSLGARAAQHDVLDLMLYCLDHYDIDVDRIYLTGGSMGGLQTTLSAAKYPDLFAAAWEWMGPTDLEIIWYELDGSLLFQQLADDTVIECGGDPAEMLFEYRRRSAVEYAMNLRTVPFKIGHGRTDILVYPHHARDLDAAIRSWDPQHYDGVFWHWGSHWILPRQTERTMEWFEDKRLLPSPDFLQLTVDEDLRYHYLDIAPREPDSNFARLQSELLPATNTWDLKVRGAARAGLYLADSSLDPGADLAVTVLRLDAMDIELIGLEGSVGDVMRNGSPFYDYEIDGSRLVLHAPGMGRVDESYALNLVP